ncbi:sulfotransferase family protein [Mesorhizobium xinjiangense]|uniref:sulfotransferase family protein n=1 Tax=Mesorhizobium xinjiangense TaxID=2678685 RepID=UPI0012ED4F4E|nr:sulfotransferase [Mesorhizobium xinjiangense]
MSRTADTDKPASPEIDPWTHRIGGVVERYPRFWIRIGDMETRLLDDRIGDMRIDRPVFVTGLARSGSTILLELLDRHPETASHRYRDFPMVFTPWLWNWFVDRAANNHHEARERAHRDRISVTPESPEAFEEVIWMAFFRHLHDPSASAVLDAATHNPGFERFHRDHIRKMLALRGASRYLAKGNYNVSRLRYLKTIYPDARFVVPVRDPVWHIASLMKQHRLFVSLEERDPRILAHMRRSGHFEFGLGRVPMNLGDGRAQDIVRLWREGDEIAGWAAYWASVYDHVADLAESAELSGSVIVVRYEDICADPSGMIASILDHCGLEPEGLAETARATVSAPSYYEPKFSASERQVIRDRTADTAARFGYGR